LKRYKHFIRLANSFASLSLFALLLWVLDMTDTNQTLDVKPDSILINYGSGPHRFREAGLGDCGDACFVNSKDHLRPGKNGYMIGAHTFRSLQAMQNLRWGTATDTWSFGTTVSDLDLHIYTTAVL
jgi:hypothetical protein